MKCPKCHVWIADDSVIHEPCGWGVNAVTGAQDRNSTQCAWTAGALRCQYLGSLSHDTHGSGPWYCREHFDPADLHEAAQAVEASQRMIPADNSLQARKTASVAQAQAAADAFCRTQGIWSAEECIAWAKAKLAEPKPHPRAWIDKLPPESIRILQRMGNWPVGSHRIPEREPGQDDE